MANNKYHGKTTTTVDKDSVDAFKKGVPISRSFPIGIEMELSESGQLGIYLRFLGMNVHGHAEPYTSKTMDNMYLMVQNFAELAAEVIEENRVLRYEKIGEFKEKLESAVKLRIDSLLTDFNNWGRGE